MRITLKSADLIISSIANILVSIGVIFAVLAYIDQLNSKRMEFTLSQLSEFQTPLLSNSQVTLMRVWGSRDLSVLAGAQKRDVIDAYVMKVIESSDIKEIDIKMSVSNIASYYDRIELCISTERCDKAVVIDQLGRYGRNFYCTYKTYISLLAEKNIAYDLGVGLEKFVMRLGGCTR